MWTRLCINTPQPLFNTIARVQGVNRVSYTNRVISKQKCIDYIEKLPLMVIFLYNLYILGSIFEPCYIQNLVITKPIIKRLWCIKLNLSGPWKSGLKGKLERQSIRLSWLFFETLGIGIGKVWLGIVKGEISLSRNRVKVIGWHKRLVSFQHLEIKLWVFFLYRCFSYKHMFGYS